MGTACPKGIGAASGQFRAIRRKTRITELLPIPVLEVTPEVTSSDEWFPRTRGVSLAA